MDRKHRHHWEEISESGIGFLKASDSIFIDGFYTTGVQPCIGIAIIGKGEKAGELTFIHMDDSSKKDKVLEILDNVEANLQSYTVKIIVNENYLEEQMHLADFSRETGLLQRLNRLACGNMVKLKPLNEEEKDVSFTISRNGDVYQVDKKFTLGPLFSKEQEMECRASITRLNKIFSDIKTVDLDTQFKDGQRTPLPEIIPSVKRILQKEDEEREKAFDEEVKKITNNVKREQVTHYKYHFLKLFDDLKSSLSKIKASEKQISL